MKINKITQGLVLIPLTGMISFMGTLPATASECSTLSPCAINSVPEVSSLSTTVTSPSVPAPAPTVPSVTAPVAPTVDNVTSSVTAVTDPIAGTINKVTAPVVDTIDNVPAPVFPIVQAPITAPQPYFPVDSVIVSPEGTNNAEIVTPADTKSAVETPAAGQSHASTSGGLRGSMMLTPSLLDIQPAAIHSAQGSITKVFDSGGFGFAHLNPVDDPVGFTGLVFAYIIVLGSAIGFAVKRSTFLNLRRFA